MQLADPGKRILAYLIDVIIVAVAIVIVVVVLDAIGFPEWLQGLVSFIGYYGYFTYLEATTGQTIGKRTMGIRVVDLNGMPITMSSAIIRNLLRIVDSLFLGLVGLILILVTQKRQRLGDFAAQTVVINA